LAKDLNLNNDDIVLIAKKSLFHLLLTALEYGKLASIKNISSFCHNLNPEKANQYLDHKRGVIFFCGHQSNWELLFLDATSRHAGVCIGKPIKNKKLYNFILNIRQKFKGHVIIPKDAYRGCMKALKQGQLVGIVGDQGLAESSFAYNCLGRTAHMTTLPALLSLRSGHPVFVATIIRGKGTYDITYTGPLETNPDDPQGIQSLTLMSLNVLDQKIKEHPEQYMWQHNRWKIPYKSFIPKKYRHDALAVIIREGSLSMIEDLITFKELYRGAYMIIFTQVPHPLLNLFDEVICYHEPKECFITHYGPKLLFDTVGIKGVKRHFKKQALFEYLFCPSLSELINKWKQDHAH
jgi:KDO2-lipid IV(A) lauroyltransferase